MRKSEIRNPKSEIVDRNPQFAIHNRTAGFTLVELMVSVALAIIVLGLFAAIYSWATDTYTEQKGIRRNDQRSRMLTIVIRSDLKNRTFRDIVAFAPGQNTSSDRGRFRRALRRGYVNISENDPADSTDDVLALTVRIPANNSQRYYLGRSRVLKPPTSRLSDALYLTRNPNHPENDDGVMTQVGATLQAVPDNSSISRAAEVVYFLRHGNLYRRVLLIRDPYVGAAQPPELSGNAVYPLDGSNSISFWRDFSFAVYYKPPGLRPGQTDSGPRFHALSTSLVNDGPNPVGLLDSDTLWPRSLGIPHLRFGHSIAGGPLPREYVGVGANRAFIGRFLSRETSDPNFGYPGNTASGDPHTRALTYNPINGLVNEYATSTANRGEDMLMSNVHEFDVKVWDSRLSRFVDLGHNLPRNARNEFGDYHRSRNRSWDNTAATPTLDFNWNRFDTWHPYQRVDPAGVAAPKSLGAPPYKPGSQILGGIDEKPLRAIQIRIRFFDVSTNQMRQVTLVEHLQPREN
ncbi:MAG: PilW family protein [Planctomycetaceae bacterium]